ncbi:MAG: BatD family protein [Alphaproteobacteria bacterium]|nr:BatD family protein [Alphaproteobacteria bacterium]
MKKIVMFLIGTVFCANLAVAETLNATVDNSQVPLGETIELKISYEGDNGNMLQPDLSVLQKDFTIYGTSTSFQTSFINGKGTQKRKWNVSLLPSGEGKYIIPAITVGNFKTSPIEINILPAGTVTAQPDKKTNGNVAQEPSFSAELTVDNENPYVQQQINAVLTLYDNRGITLQQNPVFADSKDWIIKSLGDPKVEDKDGTREIKFFYALFPQKSGRMALPVAQIEGFYVSFEDTQPSHQNIGGFFKFFDMNIDNMFGVQKPVVLKTKTKMIDVKPIAVEAGDNWWLPADAVNLVSKWADNHPKFKVGETVARELTLTASGVAETQLPDIILPESENMKQYPENPEITSVQHGDKIISQAIVRVVYIPQEGGEQILPEITVPWFDVNKQKMSYATVPAAKIFVKGQTTSEKQPDNIGTSEINTEIADQSAKASPEATSTALPAKANYMQLALIVVCAFFAGLLLSYILLQRRINDIKNQSHAHLSGEISKDLQAGDYRSARDNLLRWGSQTFPHQNINNLYDLAECIGESEFKEQMEKLNAALYAGKNVALDNDLIMHQVKQKHKKSNKKTPNKPLPDLYK